MFSKFSLSNVTKKNIFIQKYLNKSKFYYFSFSQMPL